MSSPVQSVAMNRKVASTFGLRDATISSPPPATAAFLWARAMPVGYTTRRARCIHDDLSYCPPCQGDDVPRGFLLAPPSCKQASRNKPRRHDTRPIKPSSFPSAIVLRCMNAGIPALLLILIDGNGVAGASEARSEIV